MGSAHAANYRALDGRVRVKAVVSRSLDRAARARGDRRRRGDDRPRRRPSAIRRSTQSTSAFPRRPTARPPSERFAPGKHVFLEKPIALTLEDADAILRAAEGADGCSWSAWCCASGPSTSSCSGASSPASSAACSAVSTQRLSPPADWADWLGDPTQSGGTAVDLLVHDFDQMNWLLGTPRLACSRASRRPGTCKRSSSTRVRAGSPRAACGCRRSYPFSSNIRVDCEQRRGGVRVQRGAGGGRRQHRRGRRAAAASGSIRPRAAPETVPVESADPWGPEISYFVECVEQGRDPEQGTGEQAREALRVSLAVNRSIASGRTETVSTSGDDGDVHGPGAVAADADRFAILTR